MEDNGIPADWAIERAFRLSGFEHAKAAEFKNGSVVNGKPYLAAFARYIADAAKETELVMGCLSHHDNCTAPADDSTTCGCGLSDARHDLARFMSPPVDPLLLEAREIALKFGLPGKLRSLTSFRTRNGEADDTDAVQPILVALRRGMELAKGAPELTTGDHHGG